MLLQFAKLWQQKWILSEQLGRLLLEVLLLELLVLLINLIVLRDSKLSSEIHDDALQNIKRVGIKVLNHHSTVRVTLLVHIH